MITLSGILRQSGEMTIKEKPVLKLWVEHEMPRDGGVGDLKIEEFFVGRDQAAGLPEKGGPVQLEVRPYATQTGGVRYQAVRVIPSNGKAALKG